MLAHEIHLDRHHSRHVNDVLQANFLSLQIKGPSSGLSIISLQVTQIVLPKIFIIFFNIVHLINLKSKIMQVYFMVTRTRKRVMVLKLCAKFVERLVMVQISVISFVIFIKARNLVHLL